MANRPDEEMYQFTHPGLLFMAPQVFAKARNCVSNARRAGPLFDLKIGTQVNFNLSSTASRDYDGVIQEHGQKSLGAAEARSTSISQSLERTPMRMSTTLIVGSILSLAAGAVAMAQDPATVTPATHKVSLDNSQVRVLDIHVPAGGHVPMHSHPTGYVVVAMTDCKIKFTFPDGKTSEATLHAGDIAWSDPVTHSAENLGTSECHVLNVEPKTAHAKKK